MKRISLAFLIVVFFSSVCFASTEMRFGIGANNILANVFNGEFTGVMQFPSASVFVVVNEMVSIDLGYGMTTLNYKDKNVYSMSGPYAKVLYNIPIGKSRTHVGAYYAPFYIFNSDSSTTHRSYTDAGLLLGGEVMISENASLMIDIAVIEAVSASSDPSSDSNFTGTAVMLMPQIGLRWYID